ncbi:MAG TPA: hypothetical protein VGP68_17205 [Gemmataceae bacterium]|jgi:hypothetical protein|nr:hypothetical protein [Gemmataceae bacterium]
MELKNDRELEVTREKLRLFENRLAESKKEPSKDPHGQALSQRSLKRMINQMIEEIARYEAHMVKK